MANLNIPLCQICETNSYSSSDDKNTLHKLDLRFLLTVILEIPKDNYLLNSDSSSPHQLKSCDHCYSTIHQLKSIYTQIIKLTQKFRQIQQNFIPLFSTSSSSSSANQSAAGSTWISQLKKSVIQHDYSGFIHPFTITREFDDLQQNNQAEEDMVTQNLIGDAIKTEPNDLGLDPLEIPLDPLNQSDEELDTFLQNHLKEEPQSADDADLQDNPSSTSTGPPPQKTADFSDKPIKPKKTRKKPGFKSRPNRRQISQFELDHPSYPKLIRNSRGKYSCPESPCPKQYSNKCDIELHILSIHLNKAIFKCTFPNCGKNLSCSKALQMHMDRHLKTPRHNCTECKRKFYSTIELNRHRQHAHANDFPCQICGKKFACQDYVNIHKLNMHKSKLSFKCGWENCGKVFQMKSGLDRHVNLVHELFKGKWGCEFCECRFNYKIHLKSHLWRKHSYSMDGYVERKRVRDEDAKCPVKGCREVQSSVGSLKSHMERKHKGLKGMVGEDGLLVQERETMKFGCRWCEKRYHHEYRVRRHEEGCGGNKEGGRGEFRCGECGNGFKTGGGLKRHLKRGHDGERLREKVGKKKGEGEKV